MVAIGDGATRSRSGDDTRRWLEENEFNDLYARTARPLGAYIRRMTGDADAAQDLLQETYLRILRTRLPPMNAGEMNGYAYKTASRLVQDRWRHARVDRSWREKLPAPTGAVDRGPAEGLDLDRMLSRLRPRDRAVVWLAHVEGRSHEEIAAILGLRAASIKVLLFRARTRLAALLRGAGLAPEVKR